MTQYQLKDFIDAMYNKNLKFMLDSIEKYDEQGKNLVKLTEEIILFLKNVLINKNIDIEENIYTEYKDKITNEQLYDIIKELNNSIYEMKKSDNVKLVLELSLIKITSKGENKEEIKLVTVNKDVKENKQQEEIVKEKVKPSPKKVKKIENESLEKLKQIRIDNTLSSLDKKDMKEKIEEMNNLREKMLISTYGEFISMILDSTIKASSKDNIIFVFDKQSESNYFNENLDKIQKLFDEELNKPYKPIAVAKEEWEIIKTEFNNKLKKYEYKEDDQIFSEIFKEEKQELENLFSDVIEYN